VRPAIRRGAVITDRYPPPPPPTTRSPMPFSFIAQFYNRTAHSVFVATRPASRLSEPQDRLQAVSWTGSRGRNRLHCPHCTCSPSPRSIPSSETRRPRHASTRRSGTRFLPTRRRWIDGSARRPARPQGRPVFLSEG